MDPQKPDKKIVISPTAIDELDKIWQWNAEHNGASRANAYTRTLDHVIGELSQGYTRGGRVGSASELKYVLVRRKGKGHRHVVVYRIEADIVNVLHVFHTAQDWQARSLED